MIFNILTIFPMDVIEKADPKYFSPLIKDFMIGLYDLSLP